MQNKNSSFYLQGKDAKKESFNIPEQVSFEWNMLYDCNYRCPHCIFDGKWEEYGKRTKYISTKEWIKCWNRVYDKYNRSSIVITGGEPFIYPDFINLVAELSKIHYPINISTNGSGNMDEFVRNIDSSRVSITLSFQPGYDTLENVIDKVKYLKKHGFNAGYINFCAYPPYIKELDSYLKTALSKNEVLKVIPYYGSFNGFSYPEAYTNQEKERLGLDSAWENNVKTRGVMCAAGQKSALIFPDGKVARCGQVGERLLIGNIFENDFGLLDQPMLCDADLCPCLKKIGE